MVSLFLTRIFTLLHDVRPASNFKIILFASVLFEFDTSEVGNSVCFKSWEDH
jgi:hypothetical protein